MDGGHSKPVPCLVRHCSGMRSVRFLPILLVLCAIRADAAPDYARMLDEAERVRTTDKEKSRRLLDAVQRAIAKSPDPLLMARAQLLECAWADTPPLAHRAVAIGLENAKRANSIGLESRLVACRGNAFYVEGKTRDAEADYTTAVSLARQARDEVAEAEGRSLLGLMQYERGAMADALTNLQAAYYVAARLGNEKIRLDALTMMANVYADSNVAQYDRAIEYYQQLLVAYEKHGQPNDVADTLYNIGSTFETKGDFVTAELYYRRALAAFEARQLASDAAYTRRALGSSLMKQGRAREALRYFDAALDFYEGKRDEGSIAFVKQGRGMAYRRLGLAAEALSDLDAARRYYEGEKNTRFLERNVDETALVYEQLGDWRNAYAFRKRHAALQQELAATRRDELSSRLRVQFDAEKKEQENRAFAREQKLQLAIIALTALLAVALAVLFWRQVAHTRRMRAMAMTDELTRLPNRRHILASVDIAFAAARRNGHPAALIVFDIDRFKRINDTYGHAAGDEILRAIARTCRLTLRSSDQIGRIGGEEFLIVLQPGTSATQANDIAERLRGAVEHFDFSSVAADLQVTISLGVWVAKNSDANAAIAAADTLLYRAKESGRNRVEMAAAGS